MVMIIHSSSRIARQQNVFASLYQNYQTSNYNIVLASIGQLQSLWLIWHFGINA